MVVELQAEESPIVKKSPRDKKERIRDRKKRRRCDVQSDSSEEDDVRVQRASTHEKRERWSNKKESSLTAQEQAELEREKDLQEREEFVQRMMDRDKAKTKNKDKQEPDDVHMERLDVEARLTRGETVIDEASSTAFTLDKLREQSRRAYLKKREERELNLLQQSLQDEEELFKD